MSKHFKMIISSLTTAELKNEHSRNDRNIINMHSTW